jgi:pentatricopeptide repeat protein
MTLRAVIAIVASLLIAVQVVRNAAVAALADSRPADAARIWSGHPASEINVAMTGIAHASRSRRPIPPSAFAQMADAATKEPLAPEPFLVRGVQAGLHGDSATAQRAFEAAQWRDPRSSPAAYFLADRYFRSGDVRRGLREIAALARLSPNGGAAAIPYLTQYAASPANWPALRDLFASNPQLEHPVLIALAGNVGTLPAALALSNAREAGNAQWLAVMVDTLVKAGDYSRAHAAWTRMAERGVRLGELLHDADFRDFVSPPPFNWSLTSSTVGLAERQHGGRLHVLFYGDEDGTLASQLLLLPPGTYRLTMQLAGDPARAHSLTWALWCDKAAQPLASVTLDTAAARGWQFQVPAGCTAQWLKLSGVSGDVAQQADISIGGLTLAKAVPGA